MRTEEKRHIFMPGSMPSRQFFEAPGFKTRDQWAEEIFGWGEYYEAMAMSGTLTNPGAALEYAKQLFTKAINLLEVDGSNL